jgi:hypothetical protein
MVDLHIKLEKWQCTTPEAISRNTMKFSGWSVLDQCHGVKIDSGCLLPTFNTSLPLHSKQTLQPEWVCYNCCHPIHWLQPLESAWVRVTQVSLTHKTNGDTNCYFKMHIFGVRYVEIDDYYNPRCMAMQYEGCKWIELFPLELKRTCQSQSVNCLYVIMAVCWIIEKPRTEKYICLVSRFPHECVLVSCKQVKVCKNENKNEVKWG